MLYFFFLLTLLFYIGLVFINLSEPPGGQDGMGYGLALFALGIGFTISSFFLTLSVGWKGGFDWVSQQSGTRNLLVGIGWLGMAAATFACTVFKWEWHPGEFPHFLRWLALRNGQIWIPLLMLVPYFFLLNADTRASVSPNLYKIPLTIGLVITSIMGASLLLGWLRTSAKQQSEAVQHINDREKKIHDDHLKYIAEQKTTDAIINIIPLTGRFHDEDIKAAALAKIKEKRDWEDQLVALLDNKHYYAETYTFLDGNKVDHPEKFLEPLNRSILHAADEIQKLIHDTPDLQKWHLEPYNIKRLLRAIDEQFLNKGMDFRPAILKLQEALNTTPPEQLKKVHFSETPAVNEWLKRH
jgi:hypothetical protein